MEEKMTREQASRFVGLLVGMGIEAYRNGNSAAPTGRGEAPEDIEETGGDPLHGFDMNPAGLHDMFREFDEAMDEQPVTQRSRLRLVHAGEYA